MDPQKVAMKDGKARRSNSVELTHLELLSDRYCFQTLQESPVTDHGMLVFFYLLPKVMDWPTFVGRWDENADTVDIDPLREMVSSEEWQKVRNDEPGYQWHQGKVVDRVNRLISFDFTFRGMPIFKGLIKVGILRELALNDSIQVG
jgi:hypothetical protein